MREREKTLLVDLCWLVERSIQEKEGNIKLVETIYYGTKNDITE